MGGAAQRSDLVGELSPYLQQRGIVQSLQVAIGSFQCRQTGGDFFFQVQAVIGNLQQGHDFLHVPHPRVAGMFAAQGCDGIFKILLSALQSLDICRHRCIDVLL